MPTTPPKTSAGQVTTTTPQTGTWQHPRLDEIARRQNASIFDRQNVRTIFNNLGGIIISYFSARRLVNFFPTLFHDSSPFNKYSRYLYYLLQLIFLYNIVIAFLPLFRQADNFADIPLTPGQRKLLGLQPLSGFPTPSSEFSTPPKYARTSTPLSGSPLSLERNSGFSPGKESPILGSLHGSPLSQMGRFGVGSTQRASFGSSTLNTNPKLLYDTPGTPTSNLTKGAVNLNSKWLYDKGRRNSVTLRSYT